MRREFLIGAVILGAFISPALAQTPAAAPKPVPSLARGTIVSFDGHQLRINASSGPQISGEVSAGTRYFSVETRTLSQLKATDFIGVTAVDGTNGHLRAEEIHIIPIAGVGEGQYPWDHHPDNVAQGGVRAGSMTNGTIQAAAASSTGSMTNGTVGSTKRDELTMTFHGSTLENGRCVGHAAPGGNGCVGTAIVDITASTYIAALVPAKAEDLKPGLAVVVGLGTFPDGHSVVGSATVEKNGVKPEF
jgi:hypothetical protein